MGGIIMVYILLFIASYAIGIFGCSIITIIEDHDIKTIKDLKESMCHSPAFIPIVNNIIILGYVSVWISTTLVFCIYKFCGLERLWNKVKDKRIRK